MNLANKEAIMKLRKLSRQYRGPVQKILNLTKSGELKMCSLLIDQLCEVDTCVITPGDDYMKDLAILQRVRKLILNKLWGG
tara:strand:+ start:1776 stop:2018 length:243 start_codon:yes stop_codon:yes gene_type:complete